MLFWRTKAAKRAGEHTTANQSRNSANIAPSDAVTESPVEPVPQPDDAGASSAPSKSADEGDGLGPGVAELGDDSAGRPDADGEADADQSSAHDGKVVTLIPARLSERLAEVGGKTQTDEPVVAMRVSRNVIEPADDAELPGQGKALDALRASLSDLTPNAHTLVLGAAGTGRRASAMRIAAELAKSMAKSSDWIYAASSRQPDVLKAYAVPNGTGERFVRDVHDALAKSSAMLVRLMASDSHQMTLAVLEEDHRHRSDGPLEQLKRRAEAQNIALVKAADGFVLAPMHEGKIVRADVFRALPEALQRDVEAKVTALESELQALMGALPGNDIATDDRHLALSQQAAERAVKPNLAVTRKLFPADASVSEVFDAIESDWTRRAADIVRCGGDATRLALPALQALGSGVGEGAPVVVARSAGRSEFEGEIGRDTAGEIAIRAGYLARANGGFLIVDAWRLAADPNAWLALSAALEAGCVQPMTAPGIALTADAVPLNVKLVLIAERETFTKLEAIDPRIAQHFGWVVNFESSATAFDVSETSYGAWVAGLSKSNGLRRLSITAAAAIYDDARSRAGDRSRVSLEVAGVLQTLRAADSIAASAGRDVIAKDDVATAISRRAALVSHAAVP